MPQLHDDEPVRGRDGSVVVFLSLYLLLLAFFILLNTISQREHKRSQMAIGSVAATFRAPLPADVVELTQSTGRGVLPAADPFHRQVRRVFEATLPVAPQKVLQNGNVMRITVDARDLFVAGRSTFRQSRARLLDGIADGVSKQETGVRFEVEMVVKTGATTPDLSQAGLPLPLLRAGAFARRMRASGVPAHSIAAGVSQGADGEVQFSFYARESERARISFTKLAAIP